MNPRSQCQPQTNRFYYDSGVAVVDVSTPKHPGAMMLMDPVDYRELRHRVGKISAAQSSDSRPLMYARIWSGKPRKNSVCYAHRLLLPNAGQVDHINGNGLDNRRANLRPATQSQNNANQPKQPGKTSRFKGVHRHCCFDYGKWRARIKVDKKPQDLGVYTDEIEAARAYDRAAVEYYGEFARVNFPENFPGLKVRRA